MSNSRPDPGALVDLERYPIEALSDTRIQTVITNAQCDLALQNVCLLPGFVTSEGTKRLAVESEAASCQGFRRTARQTCYISKDDDPNWPEGHPRRRRLAGSYVLTAYDLIPENAALRALYCWPPLRTLVQAILGQKRLYLNECPYQAVNILAQDEGDTNSWHFDTDNEFTVTLLMQSGLGGGLFEIVPNIRSRRNENYDAVGRVLDGDGSGMVRFDIEPGSLAIFRGLDSLHRVTPVEGTRRRLAAVMCFEQSPGVTGDSTMNATIYGERVRTQLDSLTGR